DPDGQTIRAVAIRGREPLGGLRVTPAQRFHELLVSIDSRRTGLRIRCTASSGARMIEPHPMDHSALAYTMLAAICRSSVRVWRRDRMLCTDRAKAGMTGKSPSDTG